MPFHYGPLMIAILTSIGYITVMGKSRIILGITGTNGAGKGTVVEYLVSQKNFKHFSASALISEEIERLALPVNRESMIKVGNELREKYGADVIVERLMERAINEKGNIIIESIRTLAEIDKIALSCNVFNFAPNHFFNI